MERFNPKGNVVLAVLMNPFSGLPAGIGSAIPRTGTRFPPGYVTLVVPVNPATGLTTS